MTVPEDHKNRLLEKLDEIRRRISTGEILGFMIFSECEGGHVISSRVGTVPSSQAILMLRSYVRQAEDRFIEDSICEDDGAPRIRPVDGIEGQ